MDAIIYFSAGIILGFQVLGTILIPAVIGKEREPFTYKHFVFSLVMIIPTVLCCGRVFCWF